jgi:hypothetical protein
METQVWNNIQECTWKDGQCLSAEQWKYTKLSGLLQKFSSDDIYNAEETDVFYIAMLDASLIYRHGFKEQWIL